MRGREPNFELSEEEKQELRKFKWEEFLAITCHAITRKKYKRRLGAGSQRSECPFQNSDWDGKQEVNGHSTSEDMEWQARSQWPFDPRRYGARHICLLKTTFKNDTEFSSSNSKVLADRLQCIKAHSRVNHGRFHCLMVRNSSCFIPIEDSILNAS